MSKQLAISSTFAIFAMVAMTLAMTSDNRVSGASDPFAPVVIEAPEFDLPSLPFLQSN